MDDRGSFRRPRPSRAALAAALALAALAVGTGRPASGQDAAPALQAPAEGADAAFHEAFDAVERLNAGLPNPADPPDLSTPRAALESFYDACDAGDFLRAARSLNLNSIPTTRQAEAGPILARQLKFILDRKVWFRWSDIPDRTDGEKYGPSLEDQKGNGDGGPTRYVRLGEVDADGGRVVTIALHRVLPGDGPPVWVVSRQVVDRLPGLYGRHGPTELERRMPDVLKGRRLARIPLWQWIGLGLFLVLGVGLAWGIQRVAQKILCNASSNWAQAAGNAVRGPLAFTLGTLFFYLLSGRFLRLAGPIMAFIEPLVVMLIIAGMAWFVSRAIAFASDKLGGRYASTRQGVAKQAALTRLNMARHVLIFAVAVAGMGLALWQFEWFRAFGMTLLASAGVAGIILGVAAQRSLGNILAGVQLALTQPVRVDDAVIFEDEFGWIEEIAITYIVIRTWDLRRLVVPTAYFMDKPVQNWTRNSEKLIKPVIVYADHRVPVDRVREEFASILDGLEDYDREVPPILQVTEVSAGAVQLRALCSAKDAPTSWNLHCEVRERLLAFLRELEGGRYLPRTRVRLLDDPAESLDDAPESGRPAGAEAEGAGQGGDEEGDRPRRRRRRRSRSRGRERAAESGRSNGSARHGDSAGANRSPHPIGGTGEESGEADGGPAVGDR